MMHEFSCWVLSQYASGGISSISSEEIAARLAEKYPETIYFFAELSAE